MTSTGIPLLEPREAIDFFRAKGFKTGFAWQDVWQEEHATGFTVAKAMSRDILETIRAAVDDALANGKSLEQFRGELTPLLQAKGWWGKARMIDPATGLARTVQLGSPRRLKIIYDMNMRMAQAAGRWAQIQRMKDTFPFLRYTAVMDDRTRPEHAEWHGTILPVDDPWWNSHYPPCGWNCRCTVIALDQFTIRQRGWEVSNGPPPEGPPRAYTNPRTGEVLEVPAGIDPGFVYNVGKSALGGLEPPPLLPPDLPTLEPGIEPGGPAPGAPSPEALLPDDVSPQAAVDAFVGEATGTAAPIAPVAELTGTEIAPADAPIGELRTAAFDWLRTHDPVVNPELGEVGFSRRGAKKTVDQSSEKWGGADKLRATPAVPDVIRNGRVTIEPNTKPDQKEGAIAYARITAPIRLAGQVQDMEVLVEQQANGNWVYNHRLPEAQSGRPLQSGAVSDDAAEGAGGRRVPKSGDRSAPGDIGANGEKVDTAADVVRFDPSGYPLAIGRGWFRDAGGAEAIPAGDRRRVLAIVGRALARPDEIRLRWVVGADGTAMLFRRYVATVDGLAVVVDVGKAGWRFATARDPGFDLARLASGTLAWSSSQ